MALDREALLDLRDNFFDFCRHGPWWQRLALLVAVLGVLYFFFWVRPLPAQIKERQKYMQDSMGTQFADGAVRFYDDRYQLVLPNGSSEPWTRERFKDRLREQFDRHKRLRERPHRTTQMIGFRWTGWSRLVQKVHQRGTLYGRQGVVADNTNEVDLTWEKKEGGWVVTKMHILGDPKR